MKEKNYNLELIRMISFVLVIAIHVSNYFCRAYGEIPNSEYAFSLVVDTAARVSVPSFFMISGALLLGREETLKKHCRRILRFLSVLAVWSVVYYLWNTCYMKTEVKLQEIIFVPAEAHLWYLYAMIPIYLVLPFLQVMCRNLSKNIETALLIISTGAVLLNFRTTFTGEELYYDLPLIGDIVYTYYLFFGYYISKYRKKIPIRQKTAVLICIFSMAVSFGATMGATFAKGYHYEKELTYGSPFVILASVMFFIIMIRVNDGNFQPSDRRKRIIDLFCNCSFGIYLIHILFLDNYKKYMEPTDFTAWIAIPGLTFVIAAVSFVCVLIMRQTTIGKKIT
ncbi:acyltransferase [Sellimonas sp.]|uniref:acyltransferase n=1 Tax=Sellimonas sp. TaxID=2021466 RepID=UPI00257F6BAB|nr:acyltransferase family protein [Sellimonas sp.]